MDITNNIKLKSIVADLLCLSLAACTLQLDTSVEYDTLIINGRILDGTGNSWYYADIAINDDEIVKIGEVQSAAARDTINAAGLYVMPGFIDAHSHASSGLADPELRGAKPLLLQGITTVFINPDGGGATDLKKQRQELLKDEIGVNVAQMVPHGSIRRKIIRVENRAPTPEEMEEIKQLVREDRHSGTFGLSSGSFYAPGSYVTTGELIELAKMATEFGGAYSSHIRDESNYPIGLEAAVDEVIQIAREAALPGIVTSIKALGPLGDDRGEYQKGSC